MPPDPIPAILRALARRETIDVPVAVVVAHPDDETIGAGGSLWLFRNLTMLHVTDGAPRNPADARAHGYATAASYAAARHGELQAALLAGGVKASVPRYDAVSDQQASTMLSSLARSLSVVVDGVGAVLTHAYEGGHPDHDAVAFAVQAAGVPAVEMAGYHAGPDGTIAVGGFLGVDQGVASPLAAADAARRDAMLRCFVTQQRTLAPFFGQTTERFRAAPRYDFTQPAAARIYYDGFDWAMTSTRWCALARDALRC